MRSIAEIDRDHEGMKDACERCSHGCTYPACECDRTQRAIPNVRGISAPKPTPKDGVAEGHAPLAELRGLIADDAYACTFQTFGQYRTALLKAADKIAAGVGGTDGR
jgi:hypothetical protein